MKIAHELEFSIVIITCALNLGHMSRLQPNSYIYYVTVQSINKI